ncbi:hypothetical protein WQQ_15290 [Hydrocarboniphaga effusa AP103]|uniref:Uncharacterized protein n=1 Tax=Hydrocarboniphaga effusa AP103 TaxID=1172194 RepID=I7ZI11_9GAMM|nr:hypothetical protein WQQ_15290 [Hydrocarboniphaga effusa AP103]
MKPQITVYDVEASSRGVLLLQRSCGMKPQITSGRTTKQMQDAPLQRSCGMKPQITR